MFTDGRVKWIADFYSEEVILFQIRQHITESGKPDKLLQEENPASWDGRKAIDVFVEEVEEEALTEQLRYLHRSIIFAEMDRCLQTLHTGTVALIRLIIPSYDRRLF